MSDLATYQGPALTGWRSWRILPHDTLGAAPSIRLCASGTRGLPKVWEPRSPLRAVCGKFQTTHDAPWPECECGVHAYRERAAAESHLASFVGNSNGDGALGWAFGRVSLWGRVVEHEAGWRAERAYPYEVTVHGTPELAAAVRSLYLVDVEQAPPLSQSAEKVTKRKRLAAVAPLEVVVTSEEMSKGELANGDPLPQFFRSETGQWWQSFREAGGHGLYLPFKPGGGESIPTYLTRIETKIETLLALTDRTRPTETLTRFRIRYGEQNASVEDDETDSLEPGSSEGSASKPAGKPPKCLYHVLGHLDEDAKAVRLVAELEKSETERDAVAVTARQLAEDVMHRAGAADYEADTTNTTDLAQDLYRLAMARRIHRLRKAGSSLLWTTCLPAADELKANGLVEDDPTRNHLEPDIAFMVALWRAGAGEPATSKAIMEQLSAQHGPQNSQKWSQSFVRCQDRRWTAEVERRVWKPTPLGSAVGALGREPLPWRRFDSNEPRFSANDQAVSELLRELGAACTENSGPVTAEQLARRFWWTHHGPYVGWAVKPQSVGQRLRKLAECGLVENVRTAGSPLLRWRPATATRAASGATSG